VLPVGGIKQKLFGAHRAGIREVLIPARNRRDLDDVPPEVLADVKVTLVSTVAEVIHAALLPPVSRAPDPDDPRDVAAPAVAG
jgi:ATP-dependent Lon protease